MMGRRYLITGGEDFIGSAVVRHFIANTAHDILIVDKLTYAGNLDNLATIASDPRYRFVRADICNAHDMRDIISSFRPDVLMHLAAESHIDRSIDGPAPFIETNVIGTFTLLETALASWRTLEEPERSAFRFHHVSTHEVFGSLGADGFFTEETLYRPNSPYSASKAASNYFVRAWYHTYKLPVVLSNCSNNYGPYHFPKKLIPLAILNALEGKRVPVYGDGSNVRDWLYVDDHARALQVIAEKGRVGESYNVGGHNERTNIDVTKQICSLVDELAPNPQEPRERLITFVGDRPGHDLGCAVDTSKIERELGWRPTETFETGLSKTVKWYLDNKEWWQRIHSGVYRGERLGIALFGCRPNGTESDMETL